MDSDPWEAQKKHADPALDPDPQYCTVRTCIGYSYMFSLHFKFLSYKSSIAWTSVQDMKYLDLESTRILKVDEIYPYSLQCDACQQIFIREPAAISISKISIIKMTSKRIEEDDMRAVLWGTEPKEPDFYA